MQKKQVETEKEAAKIQEEIQVAPETTQAPVEEEPIDDTKVIIDSQVQDIGAQVTTVLTNITSGAYEEISPSTGVKVYRENDEVKSVVTLR